MRKILTIGTLLIILSLVFVGCSSSGSKSDDGDSVTLEFTYWGSVMEKKVIEDLVKKFEEENSDIKIDAQHIPEDYQTKMNTLMGSKNLPDVAYLDEGIALDWATEGRIMDITPFFDDYPHLEDKLPETYYYYEEGQTIGTMLGAEIANVFYNKDIVDSVEGVEIPSSAEEAWTWDEFVEVAQKLTIDNNGNNALSPDFDSGSIKQYGVNIPIWYVTWYPLLKSNGGDITNEDGTEFTMNSPEAVEVFQNLQDLMYKYHVAPTPTQQENLPATSIALQTKQVAMTIDGQWINLDLDESGLNYGIGVLPTYNEPVTVIVGSPSVIFSDTEYPEESAKFYAFLNDPQYVSELTSNGLWMPTETKYYTEDEYIEEWTNTSARPPEYKEATIDYTLDYGIRGPIYDLKNWPEIDTEIGSKLDNIFLNKKTAQEALDELEETVTPLLDGVYPKE